MSHIPDLKPMHGQQIAIGWLHPDHDFAKGTVSPDFSDRIKEFAKHWGDSIRALGWGAAGGFHTCEFCGKALASGTFGVPRGDRIFLAPEMIAHYIQHHGYKPPDEFIAAVLACPIPGTPEYAALVKPFVFNFANQSQ